MPSLESVIGRMEDTTSERLKCALEMDTVLVLDCRAQTDFQKGHIVGSLNFNLPPLLMRRLKKGSLTIATAFQNNEMKEQFTTESKQKTVVLVDCTSYDINANTSSVTVLLYEKLRQDGCKVEVLVGGYTDFANQFPDYITSDEKKDVSPVTLGLTTLSIVEPSTPLSSETTPSPSFPIQVIKNLYLGNAKCSMDSKALRQNNIRYILNVTPNLPNYFEGSQDVDITYKQIPINDHWSQNLSVYFPEAIAFIDEARSKGFGVLVHCLAGISRSVTITVAYLMSKLKMNLNDAYDYVKKVKPNISPNFNFMGQLLDFEHTLNLSNSDDSTSSLSSLSSNSLCGCRDSDSTDSGCHCSCRPKQLFFMTPTKSAPNFELEHVNVR